MKLNYGPRLKQFAYRPLERDSFINLLDGSVRSGKTTALLPKILYACQYPVQGWRVIGGVSKASIYRNTLHDLFNLVGSSRYSYNAQTGMMRLCGSDWMVIGAGDEGSEKAVRGLTASVAFVDELTKIPQSFYNMLISRLSPDGARFYATTNPDTPNHWVKTDIIDNQELVRFGDLFYMQCTMADNPNLSESYIEKMKRQYRGAFYKRFIEGLWVTAEGAIYGDSWSDDLLYDDADLPARCLNPEDHIVSLDYGTVNPLAANEGLDDGETVWIHRELNYDSAKEQKQLTDDGYVRLLGKWIAESPIRDAHPRIVIDPSAASFRAACISQGWWVKDADNDVLEGIKLVSSVMAQRKIRINRKCENTIRELRNYAWDERAAKRGDEKPLKVNDHHADSCRYLCKDIFKPWRIEN